MTPHKAARASPLSREQRLENRVLAYTGQGAEHVIRRMKGFRVQRGVYRFLAVRAGVVGDAPTPAALSPGPR
ncbi:hypothetical protein [Deinococcus hopiensis]|uniref:hypothetical protein n=1 Tax=Deinococcus hopiensis TaxID=309885 RepID=UPI003CCB95AA